MKNEKKKLLSEIFKKDCALSQAHAKEIKKALATSKLLSEILENKDEDAKLKNKCLSELNKTKIHRRFVRLFFTGIAAAFVFAILIYLFTNSLSKKTHLLPSKSPLPVAKQESCQEDCYEIIKNSGHLALVDSNKYFLPIFRDSGATGFTVVSSSFWNLETIDDKELFKNHKKFNPCIVGYKNNKKLLLFHP